MAPPAWAVPNSCRAAATTALTGFHSAITFSHAGIPAIGTNTFDTNPSRNAGSIDRVSADCGLLAISPISAPIQLIAKANSRSRANPATAGPRPACARQPTASPQPIITASPGRPTITLDSVRPASTAGRAMGMVRNRSITPSLMSVATATATADELKIVIWANSPEIR